MEIKILGSGCANCKMLYQRVMDALAELDVTADVEKVEQPMEIAKYRVLATPGLVIDGKVKVYGRVPTVSQIKEYIKEEMQG
jgi:small redox-active disulfide protein 2